MERSPERPSFAGAGRATSHDDARPAWVQAADGTRRMLDVAYGPHPEQRLDVFRPATAAPAPLVVVVHGGGWSVGDKAQYASVGNRLAHEGLVAMNVNYRLSPAVQHPTHVQDVALAIGWCYRHAAEYGADPERLCLLGHSSGAHLAALVALAPSYLAAEGVPPSAIGRVIGVSGVGYDLDERYAALCVAPFFEPVFGADSSRWKLAAPMHYVERSAPAFLLVHGLGDTEAPPASTEVFAAALEEAGVPTRLVLVPDENHISVMFASAPAVVDFLQAPWPGPATAQPVAVEVAGA
ncbi:MAG TPA: alpha/beta hydrolase [Chloroflexota bacterium]|nr:alpha/beta hydrolase [Chloroflexota bacterium]